MKKYIYLILIICLIPIKVFGAGTNFRAYSTTTGDITGALDNTDTANISDEDVAIVADTGIYVYDIESTANEKSPWFIRPEDYSSAGVWELIYSFNLLSIISSDLTDTTSPHVLLPIETVNTIISNYNASGADRVFTMPAAHTKANIIFLIGDEYQVDIEPDSGDNFYLNGTAMAVDEHIQNTDDTLGDRIVGYCVNVNGTLKWFFYGDTNWVEASP